MNGFCFSLAVVLAHAGVILVPGADAGRPAWLDTANPAKLPAHAKVVQSELWASREEAELDALDRAALVARNFAAEVAPRIRSSWEVPTWMVEDHLLRERVYVEEVDWTYGPMYRAHALLDLSPEKRGYLLAEWHHVILLQRMREIGAGLGFILICLVSVLSYLRLDDATRGYYSRWLVTGAVAVVAGSAAVLYTWVV